MRVIEVETYKAACVIESKDWEALGIKPDDILERNEKGIDFIRKAKGFVKSHTYYEWPGCAYSMQISTLPGGEMALTFSETIEDYVYNLKQSLSLGMADPLLLNKLIQGIEERNEDEARELIRTFEKNMAQYRK